MERFFEEYDNEKEAHARFTELHQKDDVTIAELNGDWTVAYDEPQ